MRKSFLALVVSAALTVGALAASASAGSAPDVETVGGFAMKVAAAFGADAADLPTAVAALKAIGVSFEDDSSARLTERQAARILADLGMEVVPPANPDQTVSVGRSNQIATRVGLTSARQTAASTSSLPTQCLHSVDRATCYDCCKAATKCGTRACPFLCNVCTLFCKANVPPPPSPGKP